MNIQKVSWIDYAEHLQSIRNTVFIEEQKVSREEEFDGLDNLETTHHFAAFSENQELIGCARLLQEGKIGRMAVLPEYRNKNIGANILVETCHYALANNIANAEGKLYLHAQTRAQAFYERAGFYTVGETYQEAGIEHILMEFTPYSENALSKLFADKVLRFEAGNTLAFHLTAMTMVTSRDIDILSECIDETLYGEKIFVQAISSAARRSRYSRIRILLRDSLNLQGIQHALVELAKKLSSKIEIRILTENPQNPDTGYLISDKKRLVFFNNEKEKTGFVNYRAEPEALNLLEEFDNLWERHSKTDPNLQQLYI